MELLPITLIMIVRNSAGRLKEVIEYHRKFVAEVVVVDQGSNDGTWEDAQKYADYAVKRRNKGKCEGDRNFAFNLGSQPWVLNLDDDEFLAEGSYEKVAKAIELDPDIIWLKRDNLIDGKSFKSVMGDDIQCRLFKRGAVRWSDETHVYAEKADGTIAFYSDITINHIRTFEQIKATHVRRSKVLEPSKLKLEQDFVAMIEKELREKA